jgi:hypothetical protein
MQMSPLEERGMRVMRRLGVSSNYFAHVWSIIRHQPERDWSDVIASISKYQAKWFRQ